MEGAHRRRLRRLRHSTSPPGERPTLRPGLPWSFTRRREAPGGSALSRPRRSAPGGRVRYRRWLSTPPASRLPPPTSTTPLATLPRRRSMDPCAPRPGARSSRAAACSWPGVGADGASRDDAETYDPAHRRLTPCRQHAIHPRRRQSRRSLAAGTDRGRPWPTHDAARLRRLLTTRCHALNAPPSIARAATSRHCAPPCGRVRWQAAQPA